MAQTLMSQKPTINVSKTVKDYENMQKYSQLFRKFKVQNPTVTQKESPYMVNFAFTPAVNGPNFRKNFST